MPFYDQHLLVVASPHDGLPPELGPAAKPDPGRSGRLPNLQPTPMTPALSCDLQRMLGLAAPGTPLGSRTSFWPTTKTCPASAARVSSCRPGGVARLIAEPVHQKSGRKREILIEEI